MLTVAGITDDLGVLASAIIAIRINMNDEMKAPANQQVTDWLDMIMLEHIENNEDSSLAEEIMCECTGTTRGKIYDLVEQGCNLEAISRKTGVNTGCGGCESDVENFIEALEAIKKG